MFGFTKFINGREEFGVKFCVETRALIMTDEGRGNESESTDISVSIGVFRGKYGAHGVPDKVKRCSDVKLADSTAEGSEMIVGGVFHPLGVRGFAETKEINTDDA